MDSARPSSPQLVTLQEAAQKLAVSVDTLLKWNEYHILKPTITPTGEVGYTKEQIQEFLIIQQSFLGTELPFETAGKSASSQPAQPDISPILFAEEIPYTKVASTVPKKTSSPIFFLSGSAALVALFLTIIAITQGGYITAFITHSSGNPIRQEAMVNNTSLQTSKLQLTNFIEVPQPTSSPAMSPAGRATTTITNALLLKKSISKNIAMIQNDSRSTVSAELVAQKGIKVTTTAPGSNVSVNGVSVNDVSTFANLSTANKDTTTPFDNNDNLTGNLNRNAQIATSVGEAGILGASTQNLGPKDGIAQEVLFIIVALGGLALFMRKQKNGFVSHVKTDIASQTIFEIGQKLDGTVVVYHQGNLYKISKPELYSESDRFIERLMELGKLNDQEIEYDSLVDSKIKFITPLSRLVTRLGFVGIKRELFFPRTSKNRVLFRRYITQKDLHAMGLTPSEIASDLAITL